MTLTTALVGMCILLPVGLSAQSRNDPLLPEVPYSYTFPPVASGLDLSGLDSLVNTPPDNPITNEGATLGRVLFYDVRLSQKARISCASCHQQKNAFADSRTLSRGTGGRTTRNTMGLANLAYYSGGRFLWDERGESLEEAVLISFQDKTKMEMEPGELVERVAADTSYRWLFKQAFGESEVTEQRISQALSQFLRSMVSFRSKFDEGLALAGAVEKDFPNFTDIENLGKAAFLGLTEDSGLNSCASCHVLDLGMGKPLRNGLGGVIPVVFQGEEPMNNGIDSGRGGDDPGYAGVTKRATDQGKFKAPSLRNVQLTGPYMHDGRFKTLAQVISQYTNRVRPHANLDLRLKPSESASTTGIFGSGRIPQSGGTTRIGTGFNRAPPRPGTPPPRGTPGRAMATVPSTGIRMPLGGAPLIRFSETGFNFTSAQRRALLIFLRTLTDEEFVKDPKFSDPFR